MAKWLAHARFIIGALALVLVVAVAAPASAQQPISVNPTASSVKEDQLLKQMNDHQRPRQRSRTPKSYNLEQPAGRDWREFHAGDAAAGSAPSPSSACWRCW